VLMVVALILRLLLLLRVPWEMLIALLGNFEVLDLRAFSILFISLVKLSLIDFLVRSLQIPINCWGNIGRVPFKGYRNCCRMGPDAWDEGKENHSSNEQLLLTNNYDILLSNFVLSAWSGFGWDICHFSRLQWSGSSSLWSC
jgi:hypothetical protein